MVVLFVSHLSYFFFRLIFLSSRLIYTSIISFIAFFFYGIGVTMFVRFIRFIGIRCVLIGSLDVWGFKKLRDLIWHCWRSGVGGCMLIWVDCDLRCWKLSMGQWVDCDFFFFVRQPSGWSSHILLIYFHMRSAPIILRQTTCNSVHSWQGPQVTRYLHDLL